MKKDEMKQKEAAFDAEKMRMALDLAREAAADGETPVGAVVVWDDGRVVGVGRNRREKEKNALRQAEIEAIDAACKALGGWRLHKATVYVTLEPCPMCAGALVNARVRRVVYGASDSAAGAFGSVLDLSKTPGLFHPKIEKGLFSNEAQKLLSDFFSDMRRKR